MFAVLYLPDFHLQSALRLREHPPHQPIAVADDANNKGVVLECNAAAKKAGIEKQMPSPQAMARCADLTLLPRAWEQEQNAQAALLEVAQSLSSEVEATSNGVSTVDLRRARGITDWQSWGRIVVQRLQFLQLEGRLGLAPNPDLAALAARKASPVLVVQTPQAFLQELAISEINPPPDLLALLHGWGIHTLGQLTSLPRGELANRLGPEANQLWERAAGQTQRLLRLARPVEEFAEAMDFEREIETVEPLFFVLRRFLDQLTLRLQGAHRVAARMILTLALENRLLHERVFSIPAPTTETDVLFRILSAHLEGLQLEQRPIAMRLLIEPARANHNQLRFFESPVRDANRFGETVARLIALVGPNHVGVTEMENTHQPDRFCLQESPFHELKEPRKSDTLTQGLPLKRYRPALPARVHAAEGVPVHVFSNAAHGKVTEVLGPYHSDSDWWENQWQREEWDVEIDGDSLYRLVRQQEHWLIEGCYDLDSIDPLETPRNVPVGIRTCGSTGIDSSKRVTNIISLPCLNRTFSQD